MFLSNFFWLYRNHWNVVVKNEYISCVFIFFASDKLGLETKISNDISSVPTSNAITLRLKDTKDDHSLSSSYKLSVNPEIPSISVEASDPSGAFYGIQSLLALLENEKVPTTEIEDYPRFLYRGMHLDVSRNFHGKHQIMKLLDIMAKYKMNKFHFHLTDDEGWRLEIPGLEELTEVRVQEKFIGMILF